MAEHGGDLEAAWYEVDCGEGEVYVQGKEVRSEKGNKKTEAQKRVIKKQLDEISFM